MKIDANTLYNYTIWANRRVMEGASRLDEDQLHAPLRPGFLSTLGLLVHIMAAEQAWFQRWLGESPTRLLQVVDLPDLDALREAWEPLQQRISRYLSEIGDADHIVRYRNTAGVEFAQPLWQLVMHVVNHGTEHRSQAALYMAMHEIDLGNLDLTAYLREPNQGMGWGS